MTTLNYSLFSRLEALFSMLDPSHASNNSKAFLYIPERLNAIKREIEELEWNGRFVEASDLYKEKKNLEDYQHQNNTTYYPLF